MIWRGSLLDAKKEQKKRRNGFISYMGMIQDVHKMIKEDLQEIQRNLVIKRSDITKPSYNKVILLVPGLYISLFFLPWYNEKPDTVETRYKEIRYNKIPADITNFFSGRSQWNNLLCFVLFIDYWYNKISDQYNKQNFVVPRISLYWVSPVL